MDELDRIERLRWAIFAAVSVATLVLYVSLSRNLLASCVLGFATGLLGSGIAAAIAYTRPIGFAVLQSEARYNGHSVSKLRLWLGAVVPAAVVGAVGFWLLLSF